MKSAIRKIRHQAYRLRNQIANYLAPPVVVLLYHRVTLLETDPQLLAVSPQHFFDQLLWLKSAYPILRFEDDWSKITKPSIAITFDDGYQDNFREALPILKELEIPATFFISTGYIDQYREYWWDELERMILNLDPPRTLELERSDDASKILWDLQTREDVRRCYSDLHKLLKPLPVETRENILTKLRAWSGSYIARDTHLPMRLDELQELAHSSLVTIGAHTVQHPQLSALDMSEQSNEILQSKNKLESWLARPIETFSYPFGGVSDYNHDTLKIVKQSEFTKVASNFPGQSHFWKSNFEIPRCIVRDWDIVQFKAAIAHFWTAS